MAGDMSKEEMNSVVFGIQAIAEKAGFIGFSCSFLYPDREIKGNINSGGFAYMPKLPNNEDDTRKTFREMRDALEATGENVLLQVYEKQIEAAVLAAAALPPANGATGPEVPAETAPVATDMAQA